MLIIYMKGTISIEKQINEQKLKSRKITFALLFVLHAYRRAPETVSKELVSLLMHPSGSPYL